ncbi:tetratricopeptide repeat protein [Aeromonas sobria]|uniref:tetratricopeptide repeat protein n=1 Tax=Aeromonas sobria TaxID=646 RepID=UPI0011174AE1|nr:tetratricopeptide repeat protein [Aeromonas sobria]TNH79693.1 tetratricopeptide repeat protein [Aeromonas sobria]
MARDNFLKNTINTLRERVNYFCSNPSCKISTVSVHSSNEKTTITGIAAHICAASENGPRYDKKMTTADRISITNGIWLCCNCATMIDKDHLKYSVDTLISWKKEAEKRVLDNHGQIYLTADEAKIQFEIQLIEKRDEFERLLTLSTTPNTELKFQLEEIKYKLQDLEESYKQEITLRKEIEETLYIFKNKVPYDAFYKATNLLYEGKSDYAEKVLNEFIDENEANLVKVYIARAKIAEMNFDYKKAFQLYEKASIVSNSQPHIINHTAQLAYRIGLYNEAFSLLNRAINSLNDDLMGKGIYINQKGLIYRAIGDYKNAINAFEEALILIDNHGIQQSDEFKDISDTVRSNLALVYIDQGRYSLAMSVYQELLKSDCDRYGNDSIQICSSLSAIGTIHEKMNKIHDATIAYERAYKISFSTLGENHPETITHLNNLGLSYIQTHPKKSEKMLKQALEARLTQLGEKHILTATVLSNLASSYKNQGKHIKSKKAFMRALKIMLDCHSDKHPQALRIRHNLALTISEMGNKKEASTIMSGVLKDRQDILGHEHPLTKLSEECLRSLNSTRTSPPLKTLFT